MRGRLRGRVSCTMPAVSRARLMRREGDSVQLTEQALKGHVRALAQLGPRLAGTEAEQRAAAYVAEFLSKLGAEVRLQRFPIIRWRCHKVDVAVRSGKDWRRLPALPIGHTPSTDGTVQGRPVVIEYLRPDNPALRACRGRIGLVLGLWGEDPENLLALARARPAAALFVDDRFPSAEPVQDGLPMGWVKKLRVPAATIPYMDAWELAASRATVRVCIDCERQRGESVNVVARIPGRSSGARGLLICAHHDSVAIGPGADDDATGVACVLEIAAALARDKVSRDVWVATFGCEEHLSVGAEAFVRTETSLVKRLGVVLNFDSVGSLLGHTQARITGPPAMYRWVRRVIAKLGEQASAVRDVSPYSDHFFFAAAGVPAIWVYRTNCQAGRWYHHTALDTEEVVGWEALARVARVGHSLAAGLARARRLPFPRTVPREQLARLRQLEQAMANWPPGKGRELPDALEE